MITEEIIEQYADEWLTAGEIESKLGISKSSVFTWSSRGFIRAMPIDGAMHNEPRLRYHAGDCIKRRMKRSKPKPFKRRVVNGITIFRCNKCEQWLQKDSFYNDNNSIHGIITSCKKCYRDDRNKKGRTEEQKRRYNENEKAQMRRWREMAKLATEWNNNPMIDAKIVIDIIDEIRPHMTDTDICIEAGVHAETIRALRRSASKDRPVKLSTVDNLFTGLDEVAATQKIHEYIDKHRPRWHDNYDYCRLCFRTQVAHAARGYCNTCYRQRNNPEYKPLVENRWSKRHPYCVRCEQTTSKYAARGLCNACYQYERKLDRTHLYQKDFE